MNMFRAVVFVLSALAGLASSANADGLLESINQNSGVITGWAADPKFPSIADSVYFYDGEKGKGGVLLGVVRANMTSPDSVVAGNHRFVFPVPQSVKSGKPIYAYRANTELLRGSPQFWLVPLQTKASVTTYLEVESNTLQTSIVVDEKKYPNIKISLGDRTLLLKGSSVDLKYDTTVCQLNCVFVSRDEKLGAFGIYIVTNVAMYSSYNLKLNGNVVQVSQ